MIDKKTFKKAFAYPLENAGFKKRGQSWYLGGKDAIVVVNLQKSDWDDMYYVNVGIWLNALGEGGFPAYYDCHLSYRAGDFFPEQRELIDLGCSLEKGNLHILDELAKFLETQLIPFLQTCTDENNLKMMWDQGMLNNGLVLKEARWYLLKT